LATSERCEPVKGATSVDDAVVTPGWPASVVTAAAGLTGVAASCTRRMSALL
jgi:hypothetical protein